MIVLSVLASSMASPLPQSEVVVPWTGPVAATIPAGLPGAGPNVADTADVAAATSAFNAAFRAQLALVSPIIPVQPRWWGPLAATIPAGLPGSGPVVDTAEVAQAKAALARAYAAALPAPAAPKA